MNLLLVLSAAAGLSGAGTITALALIRGGTPTVAIPRPPAHRGRRR